MDSTGFVKLPQLPSGRTSFAARAVYERAKEAKVTVVKRWATRTVDQAKRCRELEQRYDSGSSRAQHAPGAEAANAALDRAWSSLYARLMADIETFGAGHPLGDAAGGLRQNLAAGGIATITGLSFVEEVETSELLLGHMAKKYKDDVSTLGLNPYVERLGELTAALKATLNPPNERPTWDQVQVERSKMYETLTKLVIAIEGYCLDDEAERKTLRESLLEPIAEQARQYAARYRARRGATDVDPTTGDEEVPNPTPANPETDPDPATPPIEPPSA